MRANTTILRRRCPRSLLSWTTSATRKRTHSSWGSRRDSSSWTDSCQERTGAQQDGKYLHLRSIEELRGHNPAHIQQKLSDHRVDERRQMMLDEIIKEVRNGRVNGPFRQAAQCKHHTVQHSTCPDLPLGHTALITARCHGIQHQTGGFRRERQDMQGRGLEKEWT